MHNEDKIQEILLTLSEINGKVNRLVSDAESEKETRKRRNEMIDKRLSDIEKWQAKWGGALIALGVIATICSIAAIIIKFTQ